jgi:hypothetical protein
VIGHVRTPYLFDSTLRQVGFDLCVEITFENGHPGYWPMVQLQPYGFLFGSVPSPIGQDLPPTNERGTGLSAFVP